MIYFKCSCGSDIQLAGEDCKDYPTRVYRCICAFCGAFDYVLWPTEADATIRSPGATVQLDSSAVQLDSSAAVLIATDNSTISTIQEPQESKEDRLNRIISYYYTLR